MLEKSWRQYNTLSNRSFTDHDYFCYHAPVPRLVEKAHQHLAKVSGHPKLSDTDVQTQLDNALTYGRHMGNSYTASLYISFASVLDHVQQDLAGKRFAFYSYGSGCVAEFFSGVIQPGYKSVLDTENHQQIINQRTALTYQEYSTFYSFDYPEDGGECILPHHQTGKFRLAGIMDHKRIYQRIS